jgi:crossover junction endodeoxyribonuclease RuvC
MRILGIDPGLAIVGWGVIEAAGGRFAPVACGSITTPAHTDVDARLSMIYDDMTALIEKYKPDQMAIEELFFNTNTTTAIAVAEARGVILLTARQKGLKIGEYTPLQVKQAVVGYGRAEKRQVIAMVTSLLKLPAPPKPDDTADALALALCHGQNVASALTRYLKK